jgi:dihydrofolate reductase
MTLTQYFTATSIDGYIADEHNSLDWLFEADGSSEEDRAGGEAEEPAGDRFADFFAGIGAMALGATTYEWMLEHEQMAAHPEKWQRDYGDTPTWVFTHRELTPVPGIPLRFVADDVVGTHAAMVEAAAGRNIWLVGGGGLVSQFVDHGLLDEIILGVAPVLLGAGAPVLPRRLTSRSLTLTELARDNGFAYLRYRVQHD